MSTYYGIKFKDLKLDVPYDCNIEKWLKACRDLRECYGNNYEYNKKVEETLPLQLKPLLEKKSWLVQLPSYLYNESSKFIIEQESVVSGNRSILTLNFTVSFKNNKDNALQQFIILLQDYIISGDMFLCIDSRVSKINYKEKFTCSLFIDGGLRVDFPLYDIKMMSDDVYEDMQYEFKNLD